MLRWLFLLLLLCNALLFFWFAQRHAALTEPVAWPPPLGELRLLSELPPGTVLPARARVCQRYQPLATAWDAERLVRLLMQQSVSAQARPMPDVVIGYRLALPLPADAARRIALLDQLALAGWVPESRGSQLSFGLAQTETEAQALRDSLPAELRELVGVVEERQPDGRYEVQVVHLAGYEISNEINRLIENSWPGIKIEKNPCQGVASPEVDH